MKKGVGILHKINLIQKTRLRYSKLLLEWHVRACGGLVHQVVVLPAVQQKVQIVRIRMGDG